MPINWQDGASGGTPLSAANLNRLAVTADIGTPGTPTGDAVKAATQVTDAKMAAALGSATATAIAGRAEVKAAYEARLTVAASITANRTASLDTYHPVNTAGGAVTLTLPTGAGAGSAIVVEKEDASANTVTLTGNIRGVPSSSVSLVWQYESLTLTADASGAWWPRAGHKTKQSLDTAYASLAETSGVTPSVDLVQFPTAAYGAVAVNTAAIAQDVIVTAPNGSVYATYWDSKGQPRIAVLQPNEKTWATFNLANVAGNPLNSPVAADSHNNLVLGIDGDGYIHVSGNHHNVPLRYVRSTNPYDITSWTAPTMIGAQEDNITYPQFVRLTGGDLLFFYRNAPAGETGSGNGDTYLNRYSRATKTWTRVAQVFKGTAPVNPTESAYINRVALGSDGTLHLFYCWRDTGDPTTNHDAGYIKSTDNGATWTTVTGGALTLPIQPSVTAPFFLTGYVPGLVNQPGASVDAAGVPHALWWLTNGSVYELHHFYYSGGAWRNDVVTTHSTSYVSRASSFSPSSGETYALYARSGVPRALRIAPTVGTEVTLYPYLQNGWEPTYDGYGAGTDLRLMIAPAADGIQTVGYAGMLTVKKAMLDGAVPNPVYPRPQATHQPEPDASLGAIPLLPGYWYSTTGNRDGSGFSPANGEWRGVALTPDRTCTITSMAVHLLALGTTGTVVKFVAFDLKGNPFYTSAAIPADGTTSTGVKTITTALNVVRGQTILLGVLQQGASTTGANIARLTGINDGRVGIIGSPPTTLGQNLAGYSASGMASGNPSAAVTLAATANTAAIAFTASA